MKYAMYEQKKSWLLGTFLIFLLIALPIVSADMFSPAGSRDVITGENGNWWYIRISKADGTKDYFAVSKNDKGHVGIAVDSEYIGYMFFVPAFKHPVNSNWYLCPIVDTGSYSVSLGDNYISANGSGTYTCYRYDDTSLTGSADITINEFKFAVNENAEIKITSNMTVTGVSPADTGFAYIFVPDDLSKFKYARVGSILEDLSGDDKTLSVDEVVEFYDTYQNHIGHTFNWEDMPSGTNFIMRVVTLGTRKGLLVGSYGYGASNTIYVDPLYQVDYSPIPAEHLISGDVNAYNDSEFQYIVNITAGVSDSSDATTYLTENGTIYYGSETCTSFNSPASYGTGTWSSPEKAFSSDNQYAEGDTSDGQDWYNYGFSIPTGANITNITVRLDAYREADTPYQYIASIELSWDGGTSWSDSQQINPLTNSEVTYLRYGLWGRTWTPAEVNSNTNFMVHVDTGSSGKKAYLDWIPISICYTTPTINETNGTAIAGKWNQTYDPDYLWFLRVKKTSSGTDDVYVYGYYDDDYINPAQTTSETLAGTGWFNINVTDIVDWETNTAGLNFTALRFNTEDPHYFSEMYLRKEQNDTEVPQFNACEVNDTKIYFGQSARFRCNVTDNLDVYEVNGTIEGINYNFTKDNDWYYYDWVCSIENPSVDWTLVQTSDIVGNYNSTNPSISIACEEFNISLTDYYAIDSTGARIDNFNTTNLEEIEKMILNFTIKNTDASGISDWYLNFTADGLNGCALGNRQSSNCYHYDTPAYKWIQYINDTITTTFDPTGSAGDLITSEISSSGDYVFINFTIDEHYNPNVFKWYDAEYDFTDVKWQNGSDVRIQGGRFTRVEVDQSIIPITADQYKLDFRVQHNNPSQPLEAYICNSTYTGVHPHAYDGCVLVSTKLPSELQDDGTKFRGIFTREYIDQIGDFKYVVLETHDANTSKYYALKTYNATASGWNTKWNYSDDGGVTWNNSYDGYETELNVNWFYGGGDPTKFVFSLYANASETDDYLEGEIAWDIDPTNNYPPVVSINYPPSGSDVTFPLMTMFEILDFNNDTLNGTLDLYHLNGTIYFNIASGLTADDSSYNWNTPIPEEGTYFLLLEACEVGTPESYCSDINSTINISLVTGNATLDSLTLYYPPYVSVGDNVYIYAVVKDGLGNNYPSAFVNITIDSSTAVMSWNSSLEMYEVVWIPSSDGTYPFTVNAQANNTLTANGSIIVKDSYEICIRLWNDINMTEESRYKNEFAWMYFTRNLNPTLKRLFGRDRFACPPEGDPECFWHGRYENGTACIDLYDEGNYTLYLVGNNIEWTQDTGSGVRVSCEFCPRHVIQQRLLLNLGNYNFDGTDETLDLYYSQTELYYSGAIFGMAFSWLMPAIFFGLGLLSFIGTLLVTKSVKSAIAMLVLAPAIFYMILTFTLW